MSEALNKNNDHHYSFITYFLSRANGYNSCIKVNINDCHIDMTVYRSGLVGLVIPNLSFS